jgi:hypothetical protein
VEPFLLVFAMQQKVETKMLVAGSARTMIGEGYAVAKGFPSG